MRRTTKLMRRQSDDTETPQQDAPAPEPTAPQDAPPTAEERVALGRCLRLRDAALAQNTRVQFLVEAVRKLGCDPGPLESFVHGECDLSQEINRGRFGITKHHQACVKRRSALSLALSGQADPDAKTHGASLCGVGYAEPKQTFPGDIICRTYAFAEDLARAVQSARAARRAT
ncbi:metalloendopeptidase [Aureococcus anophagefferens]|uniref:Mitochondrial inner membrane protease ATP23 n=1 Tax=Aureococcus anophagefferens TaxID=44056 RepID=A0ABR1G513_AURAN